MEPQAQNFKLTTEATDQNCYIQFSKTTRIKIQLSPNKAEVTKNNQKQRLIFELCGVNQMIQYNYKKNENEQEDQQRFFLPSYGDPYPDFWNKQRIILCIKSNQKILQNYQFYYLHNEIQEQVQLQYNFEDHQYEVHIHQNMNDEQLKLKIEYLQLVPLKFNSAKIQIEKKDFIQYRNAQKIIIDENDLLNCFKNNEQQIQNSKIKALEFKQSDGNLQSILSFVLNLIDQDQKMQQNYINKFEEQFQKQQNVMNEIDPQVNVLSQQYDKIFSCVNELNQQCQQLKQKHETLFLSKSQVYKPTESVKQIFSTQKALAPIERAQDNSNVQSLQYNNLIINKLNPQLLNKNKITKKKLNQIQQEQQNIEEYQCELLKFNDNIEKYQEYIKQQQKQIYGFKIQIADLKDTIQNCNKQIAELQKKNLFLAENRNQSYVVQLIRQVNRKYQPFKSQDEQSILRQNFHAQSTTNLRNTCQKRTPKNIRVKQQLSLTPNKQQIANNG